MLKLFVIVALVAMFAPDVAKRTFGTSVDFIGTNGRALTSEVVKEATKTINEAK